MNIYATVSQRVEINPITVLEQIHIISPDNWVKVKTTKDGPKYFEWEEVSAGSHSHEREVREISKEVYDLHVAKNLLLEHLRAKAKEEKKAYICREYESYKKNSMIP